MDSLVQSESPEERVLDAFIAICAKEFDPARLNPQAVVSVPGDRIVRRLVGWDGDAQAWIVADECGEEWPVPLVADGYWIRRLWVLYATKTHLSMFPWESEPPVAAEWMARLERALGSEDEKEEV